MEILINYLKPYRKAIAIATVSILISTLCDLLLPTIMSSVLDEGVQNRDFEEIYER